MFQKIKKLPLLIDALYLLVIYYFNKIGGKKVVFFYNLYEIHFSFIDSTLSTLSKNTSLKIIVINSFKFQDESIYNIEQVYLPQSFLRFLKGDLLVTAASDLIKLNKIKKIVHFFHSPVSTHFVYADNAFNNYDIFFCVGKQHEEELKRIFELKGIQGKRYFQVGYGRLDLLIKEQKEYTKKYPQNTSVLIAPSWHPENFIKLKGQDIIQNLLTRNFRVIFRPHPIAKLSQPEVLERIYTLFGSNPLFNSDESDKCKDNGEGEFNGLYESDVLISDWSGISFEFVAVKEKPIVLINTPQKINNSNPDAIGIEPIESFYRDKIGYLIGINDINHIADYTSKCVEGEIPKSQLIEHIDQVFFKRDNFGKRASNIILELSKE